MAQQINLYSPILLTPRRYFSASAMLQVPSIRGELLPAWAGTTLFVGYGLAFAAAAVTTTLRRDIT